MTNVTFTLVTVGFNPIAAGTSPISFLSVVQIANDGTRYGVNGLTLNGSIEVTGSTPPPSSGNKADILTGSGVAGKGLDTAPSLQKEFNPKSKAADKAGKK